jgi:hypothetical protein
MSGSVLGAGQVCVSAPGQGGSPNKGTTLYHSPRGRTPEFGYTPMHRALSGWLPGWESQRVTRSTRGSSLGSQRVGRATTLPHLRPLT